MKSILMVAATALVACAQAEISTNKTVRIGDREVPVEKMREAMHYASMKKNGGIIRAEGSAKGVFVVLNAQKRVAESELAPACAVIDKWIRVQTAIKPLSAPVDCSTAKRAVVDAGGATGVALVDVDGLPALLTAVEEGWAIVNVRALAGDGTPSENLASRVRKEIMRAFAFVSGGACVARAPVVMRNVTKLADLDTIPMEMYGAEVANAVPRASEKFGLVPWRQASYRKACLDGWAPSPTNEFQKAIWDEIHALPTKPIVIEPESKTQKK